MSLFEQFPYTNYHDLNLNWIIQKVKEAYSPDNPPDMAVISVNGQTGAVILYTDAIVRLPDVEDNTWNIHRIADGSSEGIEFKKNNPAVRINGTNRYPIYDQGNPPPYPVTSVDGHTGTVNTWANVGGQNLTLPVEADGEVWALRRSTPAGYLGIQFELSEDDSPCGFFILKPEDETLQKIKILTESDIPSEAGVVSINGLAGVVVLYAGDIKMASDDNTTVKQAIEGTRGLIVSDYNSSSSYSAGDFCLYLGTMYVCTGSTTGSWNPAKWTATSVAAELKSVKSKQATDESNISALQGQMTTANTRIGQNEASIAYPENGSTASTNYTVGQYIARNGSLFKVVANISAGDQFTGSNISAVDNLGHEVSTLNGNIAKKEKIYRVQITNGVTNTGNYFPLNGEYLANTFVQVSNTNEIHFNEDATVLILVHLVGKLSSTRAFIELIGGNYTAQAIGYGNGAGSYITLDIPVVSAVTSNTVIKLGNNDSPIDVGSGGLVGSRILVVRLA